MPTKINRAGQQQNYVPAGNGDASGEYGDNATGSNKHFTNFKKPDEEEPKKDPNGTGSESGEPTGQEQQPVEEPKSFYGGNGKKKLQDTLQNKLKKGKNTKLLFKAISNADDELSGTLAKYYEENPNTILTLKSSAGDKYVYSLWGSSREIIIGKGGIGSETGYYSNGGTFFHETGHAIDHLAALDGHGNAYYSSSFISPKYNMSMSKMLNEELKKSIADSGGVEAMINAIHKEQKQIEQDIWTPEMENEYTEIGKKFDLTKEAIHTNSEHIALTEEADRIKTELSKLRKEFYDSGVSRWVWDSHGYRLTEEGAAFEQKEEELREKLNQNYKADDELKQKIRKQVLPNYDDLTKRQKDLFDIKYNADTEAHKAICVKYGDLSDMVEAVAGVSLCGMGHGKSYWRKDPENQGTEAFAEIMSSKATNPQSLEVLKKYCPKAIEIFDEIIKEYNNKRR